MKNTLDAATQLAILKRAMAYQAGIVRLYMTQNFLKHTERGTTETLRGAIGGAVDMGAVGRSVRQRHLESGPYDMKWAQETRDGEREPMAHELAALVDEIEEMSARVNMIGDNESRRYTGSIDGEIDAPTMGEAGAKFILDNLSE